MDTNDADETQSPAEREKALVTSALNEAFWDVYRTYHRRLLALRQLVEADMRDGDYPTAYRAEAVLDLGDVEVKLWISIATPEAGVLAATVRFGLLARTPNGRNMHPLKVIFSRLAGELRSDAGLVMPALPALNLTTKVAEFTLALV